MPVDAKKLTATAEAFLGEPVRFAMPVLFNTPERWDADVVNEQPATPITAERSKWVAPSVIMNIAVVAAIGAASVIPVVVGAVASAGAEVVRRMKGGTPMVPNSALLVFLEDRSAALLDWNQVRPKRIVKELRRYPPGAECFISHVDKDLNLPVAVMLAVNQDKFGAHAWYERELRQVINSRR